MSIFCIDKINTVEISGKVLCSYLETSLEYNDVFIFIDIETELGKAHIAFPQSVYEDIIAPENNLIKARVLQDECVKKYVIQDQEIPSSEPSSEAVDKKIFRFEGEIRKYLLALEIEIESNQ